MDCNEICNSCNGCNEICNSCNGCNKLVMVVMVCDTDFSFQPSQISLQPLQISLHPLQSITSHQKWS